MDEKRKIKRNIVNISSDELNRFSLEKMREMRAIPHLIKICRKGVLINIINNNWGEEKKRTNFMNF